MRERALIDNDILLKIAAWGLEDALRLALSTRGGRPGMLAVARFVVRRRLARRALSDPAAAGAAFDRLCTALELLEPEPTETAMAAEFEEAAAHAGFELDAGESQLLAILLARNARLLVTGDKRAIRAIAALAPSGVEGRIAALEQLVLLFGARLGTETVRAAICAERSADTAMSICFACHRNECPSADIDAGLASYLGELEDAAGQVLIAPADLRSLAA